MRKSVKLSFLLFLLPLTGLAYEDRNSDLPEGLVELKAMPFYKGIDLTSPLGEVDDDSWTNYISDYCVKKKEIGLASLIGIQEPKFCNDGTVSYKQPKSTGFIGWEGKCGQTAAANMVYGLCEVALDPAENVDDYMRDLGPGVYPSTLKKGLNEIFANFPHSCESRGEWKWFYNRSEASFINSMKFMTRNKLNSGRSAIRTNYRGIKVKRTPLALLIRDPGSHNLHWITLVDVEEPQGKCMAVVNHWDNQYKTPCSALAKWSKGVSDSYPLIFKSYNMVVLRD